MCRHLLYAIKDTSSNRNVGDTARQCSTVGATSAVNVVAPANEKRLNDRPSNANYDPLVHLEPLTTRLKLNIFAPEHVADLLSAVIIPVLSCVTKVHVGGVERLSSKRLAVTAAGQYSNHRYPAAPNPLLVGSTVDDRSCAAIPKSRIIAMAMKHHAPSVPT